MQLLDKPHEKEKSIPQTSSMNALTRNLEEQMDRDLVANADEIANYFINNTIPVLVLQAWGSNLYDVLPSTITVELLQEEVSNEDDITTSNF